MLQFIIYSTSDIFSTRSHNNLETKTSGWNGAPGTGGKTAAMGFVGGAGGSKLGCERKNETEVE